MTSVQQLLRPLAYVRIQHPAKVSFDLTIPAILTGMFLVAYLTAPSAIPIRGVGGIISVVTEFVKFSAGFYITALAAVATFNRPSMDELMENPPKLDGNALSRRRFLAFLFGYLAFTSIFIYVSGMLASLLAPSAIELLGTSWLAASRFVFVAIYGFLAANLLTSTLLGIYFLTDRIVRNRPEVRPVGGSPQPQPLGRRTG